MTKQRNADIETRLHDDGAVSHHITFPDGSKDMVLIGANHKLQQQFIAHGSRAKLQAAINSATDEIPAAQKVATLSEAFDAGRWTMNEGTAKPKGSSLVRALAALKGCPIEEAEAYAKGLSKAEQAKLRGTPVVAAKILEIEAAERTASAGDLLSGFLAPAAADAEEGQEAA